jgi:DNA helicase MCM8
MCNSLYDKGKSVKENLNISGPLLSRFDLVFILQDSVNKQQDNRISSSIMNLYRGNDKTHGGDGSTSSSSRQYQQEKLVFQHHPESLYDRLRWVASFQKETLPLDVLRDYISYAREHCKPKLSRAAANELKTYFMTIRYGSNSGSDVAITTRQLEALIRLSQARAKAAMRDYVLREDALDVIELMRHSVMEVHTDQHGDVDPRRGGAGGTSQKKLISQFLSALRRFKQQYNLSSFTMDDLRQVADQTNVPLTGFKDFIQKMRDNGDLLKKADDTYSLTDPG